MARIKKSRKNKKYVNKFPGHEQVTSVLFKLRPEQQLKIVMRPHQELYKLKKGLACRGSLITLNIRSLYVKYVAELFNEETVLTKVANRAIECINSAAKRFDQLQALALTGEEIKALEELLTFADVVDENSVRYEQYAAYTKAQEATMRCKDIASVAL